MLKFIAKCKILAAVEVEKTCNNLRSGLRWLNSAEILTLWNFFPSSKKNKAYSLHSHVQLLFAFVFVWCKNTLENCQVDIGSCEAWA